MATAPTAAVAASRDETPASSPRRRRPGTHQKALPGKGGRCWPLLGDGARVALAIPTFYRVPCEVGHQSVAFQCCGPIRKRTTTCCSSLLSLHGPAGFQSASEILFPLPIFSPLLHVEPSGTCSMPAVDGACLSDPNGMVLIRIYTYSGKAKESSGPRLRPVLYRGMERDAVSSLDPPRWTPREAGNYAA